MLRFVARWEVEEGQALAEYGLILAFVSMVSIIALGLLAVSIVGLFDDVREALP
ncbi:MAG: Flp family type IVb pilin [Chloroflexi bacterium]|nr:Flp family type IVb pilin [Chloroflexota bacterium]